VNDLIPAVQDGVFPSRRLVADLALSFHHHDAVLFQLDQETIHTISDISRGGSQDEKDAALALHRELVLLREQVNRLSTQMDRLSSILPDQPPCTVENC
jgi:hypothetical protein